MRFFYLAAGLLSIAAFAGIWLYRRAARLPAFDRLLAALIPVSGAYLLIQTAVMVTKGPFWFWNDVRLARGVELAYGYKLYYDAHGGPINGTLHAPLGYAVFTGLGVLTSPTVAIVAGCTLSRCDDARLNAVGIAAHDFAARIWAACYGFHCSSVALSWHFAPTVCSFPHSGFMSTPPH